MATTDGLARKASGHASDIAAADCTSAGASMRRVSRRGRSSGAPPRRASSSAVMPPPSRRPTSHATASPCARHALQVRGAPAALGRLEAADGEGRKLDLGDEPHLELLREAVHRAYEGARGGEVEVRGL